METITLAQLLEAVDGRLLGDFSDLSTPVAQVDTDSRDIHSGSLFIPLVGERFDGHAYINAALEGGAVGCLTSRERESYRSDKFYVKVGSTQRALRDLAAWYKSQFHIPFVAVTGSVGKTTAKDMLRLGDVTKEILATTGISTPLGEVVVLRARSAGYVQIAGPSITTQLRDVSQLFFELGAGQTIIDGALGRKSLGARTVAEAVILCTGASYHMSMEKVIEDTVNIYRIMNLPKAATLPPEPEKSNR